MARWLVTSGESQFGADGLDELVEFARTGRLGPGDMIQPPGTTDWLYASEVPELAEVFGASGAGGADAFDDLDDYKRSGGGLTWIIAAVLVGVIGVGGYYMYSFSQNLPEPGQRLLGEGGLSFSEMVVTEEGAQLYSNPDASSSPLAPAPKNAVLELLAKRGDFYRARMKDSGTEGWIQLGKVLPMYRLGGGEVLEKYDPLYNPDRYVIVENASWMQLPEQREERLTVFQFMLYNSAQYDATDLVMVASIKDAKGHELERVEFEVEGVVPSNARTMVGTLSDVETGDKRLLTQATFEAMAAANPDLRLDYNEGVEVQMQTEGFTDASIDIVELRAIPPEE